MTAALNIFLDSSGKVRSGWRAAAFFVTFLVCAKILEAGVSLVALLAGKDRVAALNSSSWSFVIGALVLILSATVVGWACGWIFEELPFAAVGWSAHAGWFKNLLIGSAIGSASLFLATGFATAARGISFSLDQASLAAIGRTALVSAMVFIVAAAGEEALFRGYPLQTFTRASVAWLGILLTSVPFAAAHLYNPHANRTFTFVNTAAAGVWLGVAYLRTRSLWFPLGLHWSWNWAQASLLGLPVSGIQKLAPAPLLHAMNVGPDWLTGGAYGIEGGAACTLALIVSTVVVWKVRFVHRADTSTQESPATA